MSQPAKIILGAVIIAILVVGGYVYMTKEEVTSLPPKTTQQETPQTAQEQTPEIKSVGTTLEGMIISINDKNIAISNNTPEPTLFGIGTSTPVVTVNKDGSETVVGLSQVKTGENAKVLYDEEESSKIKTTKKIYLLEE